MREILKEEVFRMQVRPEGTAAADVSVVSKPFRSVAREILRSVHRRAVGAGGATVAGTR